MKKKLIKLSLVLVSLLGGSLSSNAATYDIHDGWNLLGAPCDISVSHFERPEVIAIWKWNGHKWLAHSPNEEISKLLTAYGISDFEEVKYLEGFWVNSEGDITIDVPECGTSNSTIDLTKGLVAYWSFDNCDARDDSGNGYDGKIYGNPKCVKGVSGNAFEFDGVDDYIKILNSQDMEFPEFTIVAIAKLEGEPHFPYHNHYIVINKENTYEIAFMKDSADSANERELAFALNPNWYWIGGNFHYDLNKFTFIALSFDKTYTAKFYVNGKLYKVYKYDYGLTHVDSCLLIGARGCRIGDELMAFFKGVIDEVRIYDRALSEEEVKALYDQYKEGIKEDNQQNLVYNGDFEIGTDGWKIVEFTGGAKVSLMEENGNHFIRMHHDTTDDWCSLGQEIASKLERGKTYVFSYRYRTKDNVELGVRFTEPSTVYHSSAISENYGWNHKLINDGKWHTDSFEFTVTDNNPKSDEPYLGIFFDYHFKGDVDIDDIRITLKE